jgi:hypothetical protein
MTDARRGVAHVTVRSLNRAKFWSWGAQLGGSDISVWRLERYKAIMAMADTEQTTIPDSDLGEFSFVASLRMALAMSIALGAYAAYAMRHLAGARQGRVPPDAVRIAALHGEVSTRTRHVLSALTDAVPPVQAIVILGRVQDSPSKIAALWSKELDDEVLDGIPTLLPMSPVAILRALADLPKLAYEGLWCASRTVIPGSVRDEVAMAFRVFTGAVAARWWQQHNCACQAIFGVTGTGDTTALERAIRLAGGRTVHAVHGQATGPNFLGVSDLALFRSRYDALNYSRLGSYGVCTVQEAKATVSRRGDRGLLVLSNLAHPMNRQFQLFGLRDEMLLLKTASEAALKLGPIAQPLRWKPHPVIAGLKAYIRENLRKFARRHGFEEVAGDMPLDQVAGSSRWVVSSPSTVAIDLLQAGILSIVLDPQDTVLDTALAGLPTAACEEQALTALCSELDSMESYRRVYAEAIKSIGPARKLDLHVALD